MKKAMIANIKKIIRKTLYPNTCSSEAYTAYLRKRHAKIGDNILFTNPEEKPVDDTCVELLEMGEGCFVSSKVTILLHDYSFALIRKTHNCLIPKIVKTKIGNNVFLGRGCMVLMGAEIGDNCIIGAGSVVAGKYAPGSIVVGNPGRVIGTIDEYAKKLMSSLDKYAKDFYETYSEIYKRPLSEWEMDCYMVLWKTDDYNHRKKIFKELPVRGDDIDEVVRDLMNYESIYESYQDFLDSFSHKF